MFIYYFRRTVVQKEKEEEELTSSYFLNLLFSIHVLYNPVVHVSSVNGAPFLPLLYITINVAFKISLLNVVEVSSAVVSSLLVMLSVPISGYILSLPLPYLPEGTT